MLLARSAQNPSLAASASASIVSGSVVSVVLLDGRHGGLKIRTVLDAAAAARPPRGPVSAGGGGEASVISGRSNRFYSAGMPALAASIALGAAVAVSRMARRRGDRIR